MTGDEERIKGVEDKGRGRVRIEDRASAMLILEEFTASRVKARHSQPCPEPIPT